MERIGRRPSIESEGRIYNGPYRRTTVRNGLGLLGRSIKLRVNLVQPGRYKWSMVFRFWADGGYSSDMAESGTACCSVTYRHCPTNIPAIKLLNNQALIEPSFTLSLSDHSSLNNWKSPRNKRQHLSTKRLFGNRGFSSISTRSHQPDEDYLDLNWREVSKKRERMRVTKSEQSAAWQFKILLWDIFD